MSVALYPRKVSLITVETLLASFISLYTLVVSGVLGMVQQTYCMGCNLQGKVEACEFAYNSCRTIVTSYRQKYNDGNITELIVEASTIGDKVNDSCALAMDGKDLE